MQCMKTVSKGRAGKNASPFELDGNLPEIHPDVCFLGHESGCITGTKMHFAIFIGYEPPSIPPTADSLNYKSFNWHE